VAKRKANSQQANKKPEPSQPKLASNPIQALEARMRRQFFVNVAVRKQNEQSKEIVPWIERNRWIAGMPWSFSSPGPKMEWGAHDVRSEVLHRPYLRQYLEDRTEYKSVIKPRQSEFSENAINENLFMLATNPAFGVAHVFPTDKTGTGFSTEKIKPAIDQSPNIYRLVDKLATERITFKNGGIYSIAGALGRAAGRAGSRDMVTFDEFDFMPESIIGVFEQLLSHSRWRLQRFISTPTVPGVGIDKKILEGCGYHWHVTCPKCKKKQRLTFPDNLINFWEASSSEMGTEKYFKKLSQVYIGCRHCGQYLDRNSQHYLKNSEWIAERPALQHIHSSYHVNVFMIAWKTGVEIARRYHLLQNYVWQFYNEVVGVAYIKGSSRLNQQDLITARRQYTMYKGRTGRHGRTAIGVDWGENSSWAVIVSDQADLTKPDLPCVVYAEEINNEALAANGINPDSAGIAHVIRVLQLMDIFDAMIVVNDANGIGIDRNKELLKKIPSKAYGAFFDTMDNQKQMKNTKLTVAKWEEKSKRVTFSKLLAVKEMQTEVRHGGFGLPDYTADDAETLILLEDHLQNLGIQPRWNMEQEREYEVVVKFGEDHFFDATMYARLGFEKLTGLQSGQGPGVIGPR